MTLTTDQIARFLRRMHPYDALPPEAVAEVATAFEVAGFAANAPIYAFGQDLPGLFLIYDGTVEVRDSHDVVVSHLGVGNSFGERGLLQDGQAVTSARAETATTLLVLPTPAFHAMLADHTPAQRFFDRSQGARKTRANDLATTSVDSFMARNPVTATPDTPVCQTARLMRDKSISSLCICQGDALIGILTTGDLVTQVLAEDLPLNTPVSKIMTPAPLALPPTAIGSDVLHAMMERNIGHIPIVQARRLVGIVTQTDLTRFQAISSAGLVSELAAAQSATDMVKVTARIPQLL
ncbi:MAG: CBS domain-containing protein, partial [Shimia sp.]|uniref:CBS domain-containing protein n=1 Tax=Shimia sp. TaxID=1954381 RepID=UPI004057D36C